MLLPDNKGKRNSLSVVIPVYNEEKVLNLLHQELTRVLNSLNREYEIIYVDDGSVDSSYLLLKKFAQADRRVKVIKLARNFGQQAAVSCGLEYCKNDGVIIMDADLQDSPELIKEFVKYWQMGYDIVYHIRKKRLGEPFWKVLGTKIFYFLLTRFSNINIPPNVGLFRLVDRKVVLALKNLKEEKKFLPGLFAFLGFSQIGIESERGERKGGRSKSFFKLAALAIDGLINFTSLPIRIIQFFSLIFIFLTIIFFIIFLIGKGKTILLFFGASFFLSVLFIALSIVGEYLLRIHFELKQRPEYIIQEIHNL
jgi:dolichol-phosphate mannosyltransferase|uniref:Glycosyltransferase n=1 Tax=candidate division WOR-3 bacterium TaxID=2052148 RepID=A0A7V5XZ44_UNCW3